MNHRTPSRDTTTINDASALWLRRSFSCNAIISIFSFIVFPSTLVARNTPPQISCSLKNSARNRGSRAGQSECTLERLLLNIVQITLFYRQNCKLSWQCCLRGLASWASLEICSVGLLVSSSRVHEADARLHRLANLKHVHILSLI